MSLIEIIARALIIQDGKVLLAHKKGETNTFLPGGHVEYGEYSDQALQRELMEELGIRVQVGEFIGVLEHKFKDRHGVSFEEINIVFQADILEGDINASESHLEFWYTDLQCLKDENLLPVGLIELIPSWLEHKRAVYHR